MSSIISYCKSNFCVEIDCFAGEGVLFPFAKFELDALGLSVDPLLQVL